MSRWDLISPIHSRPRIYIYENFLQGGDSTLTSHIHTRSQELRTQLSSLVASTGGTKKPRLRKMKVWSKAIGQSKSESIRETGP